MKVVAIIQARLGSTRLPKKVLLDLTGEPMLARVINRVRRARRLDEVVIATTTEQRDDELYQLCQERSWACFRGSEQDVLDRYYQAAKASGADIVVRITSDCPLIEPAVIDAAVETLERDKVDYVSNVMQRTYPRGLDVEVFTMAALEKAWRADHNPAWREHVTQFIVRHPDQFSYGHVTGAQDWSHLRWTVDTPQDYELIRMIYEAHPGDDFTYEDVLALLPQNPDWLEINRDIEQKKI